MIFLFIGIILPLICLVSISYRGLLFYFATRDSCVKASKASSFTDAQARANAAFTRAMAGFSEISGTQSIQIVIKPLAGGNPVLRSAPLPQNSIDTNTQMYLIRETSVGRLNPLIAMTGGYMGLQIPGLTTGFPIRMKYESYVENPNGLTE